MLIWTLLLVNIALGAVIRQISEGGVGTTNVVSEISATTTNHSSVSELHLHDNGLPHQYIVKFGANVSDEQAELHMKEAEEKQKASASQLNANHTFFAALPENSTSYGGITTYLHPTDTFHLYFGYFTEEVVSELRLDSLVQYIEQVPELQHVSSEFHEGESKEIDLSDNIFQQSQQHPLQARQVDMFVRQKNAPWHLSRINHIGLSKDKTFDFMSTAGSNVNVYIMDTGVSSLSMDLKNRVRQNGYSGTKDTADSDGHGTCVASLVGGTISGVAKKAIIIPIKALLKKGAYEEFTAGAAYILFDHLIHSEAAGFQGSVVNMSFMSSSSTTFDVMVNDLIEQGIHVVAGAANDNMDACKVSPASNPNAITVGAIDQNDNKASYSNWGSCVDVYAPGTNIYCASNTKPNVLERVSGTSLASPIVSGIVASILSFAPQSDSLFSSGLKISQPAMKRAIVNMASMRTAISYKSVSKIAYLGSTLADYQKFYSYL